MENQNQTKNAVIYCRVSTKEQVDEGNSLTSQQRYCCEYAARNAYTIVKVFIEQGESAKSTQRTELQNLLTFCSNKKNHVQAVIIYKIDRLSRNTDDYSQIRLLLKRYGIEIRSTSEHFENTPAGRFMENIIANVAQFDNDIRTERSIGGMRQAALEGRYVWRAPIGYANSLVNGKSNIVQTDKALLIKKAFEETAKGFYCINEIRLALGQAGLTQKDGKPLAKSLFYSVLKNIAYAGIIKKFGETFDGSYEPIISRELFELVQRRIRYKKTSRTYLTENPDFPLRRFVVSPSGEKLTGCWCQGNTKKYPYYRFHKSKQSFKRDHLERLFAAYLNQFAIPEKYFNVLRKFLLTSVTKQLQQEEAQKQSILMVQKQLKDRKQLLIDKCLEGTIPDMFIKEQLEDLEEEIGKITLKLDDAAQTKTLLPAHIDRLKDLFLDPASFWQQQPFEIKKRLQKFEFPKGIVFNGKEFQTHEICSIFKLNELFSDEQFCMVHSTEPSSKHLKSATFSPLRKKQVLEAWADMKNDLIQLDKMLNDPEEADPLESTPLTFSKN